MMYSIDFTATRLPIGFLDSIYRNEKPMKVFQYYAKQTQGDLTRDERNAFYWSSEWRRLSKQINERDNHECIVCKLNGQVTVDNLLVHHVLPMEAFEGLRLHSQNLVTVCQSCHNRIHFDERSLRWDDEWW